MRSAKVVLEHTVTYEHTFTFDDDWSAADVKHGIENGALDTGDGELLDESAYTIVSITSADDDK